MRSVVEVYYKGQILMENIRISIIVPVYNLGKLVENAIQSICNQTYQNIEIIIVNDGSNDNTADILAKLAADDQRIIIISKKNEGVTKARMSGIKVSTGDWIGFVDGDDYVEPDMFQRLLSNALKNNADISHCGYQMVFPDRVDYYYKTGKIFIQDNHTGLKDLLTGNYVEPGLWNKLYKRELIMGVVNSDSMDLSIKNNEDLLMNYYLFQRSSKSVYEDFCPYHYIIRKGSAATAVLNQHKLQDPLRVLNILLKETEHIHDLQLIVKYRMVAQLIYLATLYDGNQKELVSSHRKAARKKLKTMLVEILGGEYSKKQKIQGIWVAIWPWSYSFVHTIYAKIRGLDKKYDVNE